MKIEVPGGHDGRVNILHFYYRTDDMPQQVADALLAHVQKQEEMS